MSAKNSHSSIASPASPPTTSQHSTPILSSEEEDFEAKVDDRDLQAISPSPEGKEQEESVSEREYLQEDEYLYDEKYLASKDYLYGKYLKEGEYPESASSRESLWKGESISMRKLYLTTSPEKGAKLNFLALSMVLTHYWPHSVHNCKSHVPRAWSTQNSQGDLKNTKCIFIIINSNNNLFLTFTSIAQVVHIHCGCCRNCI